MVRKTREDLKDAISTGSRMFGRAAAWREKGGFFPFTNGARLYCAYLETDKDAENYQGWSLTRVYVEELTQYASSGPVFKLMATLRSPEGVPCQLRATCNPGGVGHHWVKNWIIDNGPYVTTIDPETGLSPVFIPARVQRQSGAARQRSQLCLETQGFRHAAIGACLAGGRLERHRGRVLPRILSRPARHFAVLYPPRMDPASGRWTGARRQPFSVGWWVWCRTIANMRDGFAPRCHRPLPRIVRDAAGQTQ